MAQLRESLARSREMMLNVKLDPASRQKWAQVHTNTAQALNLVLRDRQLRNWEKRLREMEARGYIPRGTVHRLKASLALREEETDGSGSTEPRTSSPEGRPE